MSLDENDLKLIEGLIDKVIKTNQKIKQIKSRPKKRVVKKTPTKRVVKKILPKKVVQKTSTKVDNTSTNTDRDISYNRTRRVGIDKSDKIQHLEQEQTQFQCRTEPMKIVKNRPNLFLNSVESKLHKSDSKIDKLLFGDQEPAPRRSTVKMLDVQCKICGNRYTISPSLLFKDPESNDFSYICDNCIRR